jgi:tetratricopeptide (TPR) repeat protein
LNRGPKSDSAPQPGGPWQEQPNSEHVETARIDLSRKWIARWLPLVAVLAMTAVVYAPTLTYGFVLDDESQILANPDLRSFHFAPVFFKSHVWAHMAMGPGDHPPPYYRPVFLLWLLVNYQLLGTSIAGWHFTTVLLHMVATCLVYLFGRRLTGDPIVGMITALLFGLHAAHVEAVAWVSGVSEPLAAVPCLGAMLCYLRGRESARGKWWAAASVALYGVALLAKETTIVLPAALLAYEMLFPPEMGTRQKRCARAAFGLAPYVLVTAVYLVARYMVLRDTTIQPIPTELLLMTWPSALWFYARHLIWPAPLSLLYDFSYVQVFSLTRVVIPAVAVLLLGAGIWCCVRRNREAKFCALWMLLFLLPPLYLPAFSITELVHDRYLYLPSIGYCSLLAFVLRWILGRVRGRAALAGMSVIVLAALLYGYLVVVQSRPWADEVSLFRNSVMVAPSSNHAFQQFAYALAQQGHCADALPLLATVVDHEPDNAKAVFGLGACYFHTGNLETAEALMLRTIELNSHYQQPYLLIATIRLWGKRVDDAEWYWRKAVSAQQGPNEERTLHCVRGEILRARGDFRGAIAEFRKELEVQPGNQEILAELNATEVLVSQSGHD